MVQSEVGVHHTQPDTHLTSVLVYYAPSLVLIYLILICVYYSVIEILGSLQ